MYLLKIVYFFLFLSFFMFGIAPKRGVYRSINAAYYLIRAAYSQISVRYWIKPPLFLKIYRNF